MSQSFVYCRACRRVIALNVAVAEAGRQRVSVSAVRRGEARTVMTDRQAGRQAGPAYRGPAGLPMPRGAERVARLVERRRRGEPLTAGETMELAQAGVTIAARGGAKIWSMREAWMPSRCTCKEEGRQTCLRHKGQDGLNAQMDGADPDGFAVFGQFPYGFLADVVRMRILGDVHRDEILHVCSGTLGPRERWTVDMRTAARPTVVARGEALPFRDASFAAVMIDPPYTEEYARNLYRSEFPRPSHLLREAARVVRPGGRIGLLHIAVPITPANCDFVTSFGVVPGPGFRIRAFTVYQRQQVGLPFEVPA